MTKIKTLSLIFILSLLSSITSHAQENEGYFLHTIKKGENLYTIATMYNVSEADIIKLNPGSERVIYSGKTLAIPQKKTLSSPKDIFYTIKSGDTLYRLSVNYKISIDAIVAANPGLSAKNFKAGQVIRIPQSSEKDFNTEVEKRQIEKDITPSIKAEVKSRCKEMHKVKRRETIYSVSRKYGITEEQLIKFNPELKRGMKRGMYLCIPNEEVIETEKIIENPYIVDNPPTDNEVFSENALSTSRTNIGRLSAAIILPFSEDKEKLGESYRMLEFYEGFLMAVDSLKQQGVSMDLHVFNSGESKESIYQILRKPEFKEVDIIFGPLYKEQIAPLATYSKEHNIRLVLPFTAKTDLLFTTPNLYQINTPQSYLYSEVYQNFAKRFANPNVIFVETSSTDNSKSEFIEGFKTDLNERALKYQVINANDEAEDVAHKLDYNKKNIFIPLSGREIALNEMLPLLNNIKEQYPEVDTSLFGYPEWQTYTKDYIEVFFNLDTYFYSSFYTNNLLAGAKSFIKSYQNWYSKSMIDTYPKYGMLGFDIGFFFLKGLATYGGALEKNIHKVKVNHPIQTGLNFNRVNAWGGFVNRKVFFVHFSQNFELTKIDFE